MQARDASWSDGLLEGGLGDAELATLLGWDARVARMVEVEAALARALGQAGLLSDDIVAAIVAACDPDHLDRQELARLAASAPTPVIPLVRMLAAGGDTQASAHLHHGATSQDIVDTAMVLQLRDAMDALESQLMRIGDRCAALADTYRDDVTPGRTLGQQAVPITFGLKAARWLGAVDRRVTQLRSVRPRVLILQLGGAAGTLAVYGERGHEVAQALAAELDLEVPDLPWHAERDRIVELAGALTGIVAAIEKIAGDVYLLAQTELGEVWEESADLQSSAMPHKRNPTNVVAARAACRLAHGELSVLSLAGGGHEHERAAGALQAEWVALPSALVRVGGALRRLRAALADLRFDPGRAEGHLESSLGAYSSEALSTALAAGLGRQAAQGLTAELVGRATSEGRHLREVALEDERTLDILGRSGVLDALDSRRALSGIASAIDRALATHRTVVDASSEREGAT